MDPKKVRLGGGPEGLKPINCKMTTLVTEDSIGPKHYNSVQASPFAPVAVANDCFR